MVCKLLLLLVVHDFNIPKINWNVGSSGDSIGKLFLDFVTTNSFLQFVNFPTRANNTLDLILANDQQVVFHLMPLWATAITDV